MANSRNKKKRKRNAAKQRAFKIDAADYREDFFDYESKLAGTPQRFGDTRPIYTRNYQDYDLLENVYHKNGIAHKIVTKPAEDATRNGWRLVIPDDAEKQAKYQSALDDLDLKKVFSQELIYQRLHGDGYVNIGIDEPKMKADLYEPLDDPPEINKIAFVHAFGQNNVKEIETNDDPTSPNYMKESAVVINNYKAGEKVDRNGMPEYNPPKNEPIVIDSSRYFHISMDKLESEGTGTSIITRCYDQIKTLDTALYSAGKIMYAWDINVVYSDAMPTEDDEIESNAMFKARSKQLEEGMGTDSVLLLTDGEKFERVSTNVGGFNNLLDFAWQNLAAASNIPKSVLLGEQAGTLAGASQDVANYYDGIKAIQEDVLRPQIERIVELLMWATDVADGSEDPSDIDWHIEFNPLWSADDKTQSETLVNHANAASTLVNSGIYDLDEAKQLFDGQGNNNVQGMQNKTDSADELLTDEEQQQVVDDYKKDVKKAKHGKKSFKDKISEKFRKMVR